MKVKQSYKNRIIALSSISALAFIITFSQYLTGSPKNKEPIKINNVMDSAILSLEQCSLLIRFGSYGSGIDQKAHARVLEIIKYNNAVKEIQSHARGKEGEHSLCVSLKETSDAKLLYKAVKKQIPSFSKKGYTSIEMKGVKKFQSKLR